jgi:hypothetical protein
LTDSRSVSNKTDQGQGNEQLAIHIYQRLRFLATDVEKIILGLFIGNQRRTK